MSRTEGRLGTKRHRMNGANVFAPVHDIFVIYYAYGGSINVILSPSDSLSVCPVPPMYSKYKRLKNFKFSGNITHGHE